MSEDKRWPERREARERATAQKAIHEQRAITYVDDDGCEVTVTAGGHVFYNAADWY